MSGLNSWVPEKDSKPYFGTDRTMKHAVYYYPRSNRLVVVPIFRIGRWIHERTRRKLMFEFIGLFDIYTKEETET